MKTLTSKLIGLSAAVLLSVTPSFGQTTATTDPVGFITLNIAGGSPSAVTFLGLSMTRPIDYQGFADTVAGAVITSANATWTDNQFASTPLPGYFLEVSTGAKAGLLTQVVSCNDAANTITVADDLQAMGVGNGVSFKLRKNWSLASLFGSANEAGLGGGTAASGDLIAIYDPTLGGGAGGYNQYFYSTGGLPGVGWRKVGGGSANQADTAIWLDDGLVVTRKQVANLAVVVTGAVKLGQTISPVLAGPNFIGNVYPSGSLTLGNSNLYTGSNATGVVPGTAATADLILIYDQTLGGGAGGYNQYFYSSGGLPGIGWRKVGGGSADQAGVSLDSGKSIVLKRNSGGPFSWTIPQPFPNP